MATKTAPATQTYQAPRIERRGNATAPSTRRYPRVIGGVCEYCGIIDHNRKSEEQYTLCPHFRALGLLQCSYCDQAKDPVDVLRKSDLSIAESPYISADGQKELIVWCDSYECSKKHRARFDRTS